MIYTPQCYKRHCKHFLGVSQPDGTEMTEVVVCKAFPKGIPEEIAYGDNKHKESLKDQDNDITFEKGPFGWEE